MAGSPTGTHPNNVNPPHHLRRPPPTANSSPRSLLLLHPLPSNLSVAPPTPSSPPPPSTSFPGPAPQTLINPSSPQNWLLFVDKLNLDKPFLRCPFTSHSEGIGGGLGINVLDFGVQEVCRYYTPNGEVVEYWSESDGRFSGPHCWRRKSDRILVLPNGGMILLDVGCDFWVRKLWYMSVEEGFGMRSRWYVRTCCGTERRFGSVDDVLDHKGRVYVVCCSGKTYVVDYDKLESANNGEEGFVQIDFESIGMTQVAVLVPGHDERRKRLVESNGKLYWVVRCCIKGKRSVKLKVYGLDVAGGTWVEVTSIGDRVFFVSCDFSFSMSARDLAGSCRGNCILFAGRGFLMHEEDYDESIYKAKGKKGLIVMVYHMDGSKFGMIASFPEYSKLLWHPLTWLTEVGCTSAG